MSEPLLKFLGTYGGVEPPQDPVEASTDGQLKSIATLLMATFAGAAGTVIDLGAGRGTLLSRLVHIEPFLRSKWEYLAVEEVAHHQEIFDIAFRAGIHKRVTTLDLGTFYGAWPQIETGRKVVIVVRNVLHELDIAKTAVLLAHLGANAPVDSLLILQDLAVFPVAEKGNVCWDRSRIEALITALGFRTSSLEEGTKSGNLWFNIVASREREVKCTESDVRASVLEQREAQWRAWAQTGALTSEDVGRDLRVAKIDFDLQFAALTLELLAAGATGVKELTRKQSQVAALELFERGLSAFTPSVRYDSTDIAPVRYFKDRANSQESLQAFLAGDAAVAGVSGPAMMGKSVLVQHVLSSFAHGRKHILLDALASWSVWNLLESLLSECGVHVPSEIVGRMTHISLETIENPVTDFVARIAGRSVLVVDHFERLLGPKRRLEREVSTLLTMWALVPGAKVILTSRQKLPDDILAPVLVDADHPPVGRFPEGPHVENLLSMFIPVHEFPRPFIEAIDRHPMMAVMAGRILEKDGARALTDPELQRQLRDRLRDKLMERLCTDGARPALLSLMQARSALPRPVAEAVTSSSAIAEALDTGLAYEVGHPGVVPLVACVRGFRYERREDDDETPISDQTRRLHAAWASHLTSYYKRVDDDPRWIREAYFHTAISGGRGALQAFGVQFRSELQDAGEYWFLREKDFENALWAFQRVAELSAEPDPSVSMRIASCQIRTGAPEEGLRLFRQLFDEYPEWLGVRTSCVDGLLYLQRFSEALDLLQGFTVYGKLTQMRDSWLVGQYGRSHFGMSEYGKAEEAFRRQLQLDNSPVVVRSLARSLHRQGKRNEEGAVLTRGLREHPDSLSMVAALGGWLEANGRVDDAIDLLEPALRREPASAWLAMAYVKTLIAADRTGDARRYLGAAGARIYPEFMRPAIDAQVLRAEGRFEDALACLDAGSEDRFDRYHRTGQRAEVYAAWASTLDPSAGAAIAKRALSEIPETNNLLINVSVLKLCLLADARERFHATLATCRSVNPDSEDVAGLAGDGESLWGSESS